jgi:hypothetical protein
MGGQGTAFHGNLPELGKLRPKQIGDDEFLEAANQY